MVRQSSRMRVRTARRAKGRTRRETTRGASQTCRSKWRDRAAARRLREKKTRPSRPGSSSRRRSRQFFRPGEVMESRVLGQSWGIRAA